MKIKLRQTVAALALLGPVTMALPIAAQAQAIAARPTVNALQLTAEDGLAPGAEVQLTVRATPRSRVDVNLNDRVVVPLREISPGVYSGIYNVRGSDRIDANGLMRVSVASGGLTTSGNYTFPPSVIAWQNGAQPAPPLAQAPRIEAPRIERFTAMADGPVEPGAQVRFMLTGAAGGEATLNLPGIARNLPLDEVRPGVYRGSYTLRRQDNFDALDAASVTLRLGDRAVGANLTQPIASRGPGAVMGAAPLAIALQPQILSHSQNDSVDRGPTQIRGRTVPFAVVRVRVDAVPPLVGQRLGVAQQLVSETVQADAQGNFAFDFNPRSAPIPGTRFEVSVTANERGQSAESRITLMQRG